MPMPLTKMPSCSNQEFSHEQSDIGFNPISDCSWDLKIGPDPDAASLIFI